MFFKKKELEIVYKQFFFEQRRHETDLTVVNAIFQLFVLRLKHLVLKYELTRRDIYHVFHDTNNEERRIKNFLISTLNTSGVDVFFVANVLV